MEQVKPVHPQGSKSPMLVAPRKNLKKIKLVDPKLIPKVITDAHGAYNSKVTSWPGGFVVFLSRFLSPCSKAVFRSLTSKWPLMALMGLNII